MEPSSPSVPEPHDILSVVAPWIHSQRWGPAPTSTLACPSSFSVTAPDTPGHACVWLIAAACEELVNVPLVLKNINESPGTHHAPAIGRCGDWEIYDATADQWGHRVLYGLCVGTLSSPLHITCTTPLVSVTSSSRLTSEQSNTSIVYARSGAPGVILKVIRRWYAGHNPDVELSRALRESGTVPRIVGSAALSIGSETADVLVCQEFVDGARDAWQVAQAEAASYTGDAQPHGVLASARALGTLTRTMHGALAARFSVCAATAEAQTELRESWLERLAAAVNAAPELAEWEGTITTSYSATAHVRWPQLQRIHGDFHLGNVLLLPDGSWKVIDFEGEPLRPLRERVRNDLALRDVAGMLRSFDYVAGAADLSGGHTHASHEWAQAAQAEFFAGYGDLDEEQHVLLDALTLDKALYEVAYETHERPSWVSIPLASVHRMLESS